MPDTIKDGTGTGNLLEVSESNRAQVDAVVQGESAFFNSENADGYIYYSDITPVGPNDVVSYIKNTSDKTMVINWFRIWSGTSAEAVDIFFNKTGTPSSTVDIVPHNMNVTSNKTADGDFFEGSDITGLSGGVLVDRVRLSGNGEDVTAGWPNNIVLEKGGVITLQALNGAIPLEITVSFYYK